MRASYTLVALVSALPLLSTATASAHFGLTTPPSVKPADKDGKGAPPCGPDTTAAATPTAAQGGHDLDISLDETNTSHPGFYRIALSLHPLSEIYVGGQAEQGKFFPVDNVVKDKDGNILPPGMSTGVQSASAEFAANPVFPVLADHLFPHDVAMPMKWVGKVKLPNVNCDRCTLQVIEFMAQHGWNTGGGYFYHHCAELKITADPGMPIFDPNGTGGSGMGGAAGSGGAGGAAAGAGGTGGAITTGTGGVTMAGSVGIGGASTAGAGTTGGTATTTGAAGSPGTAGTRTNPGTATTQDSSGCGVAKHSQGAASALAALGILFALGRRRRAR